MRVTATIERGEWLRHRIGREWGTVAGVAGTGFASYVRILHPLEACLVGKSAADGKNGPGPSDEVTVWPWSEVANRNGTVLHPLAQWARISNDDDYPRYADGWEASAPALGDLGASTLGELTTHLADHTHRGDDVTAGIWEGWGVPQAFAVMIPIDGGHSEGDTRTVEAAQREIDASFSSEFRRAVDHGPTLSLPGRDYVLLETSLSELSDPDWGYHAGIGWQQAFGSQRTPQLLWPADRAWVLASEIDWDSTIVAGSAELIASIVADRRFEAFEVQPSDQLTADSDLINTRADGGDRP